MCEKSIDEYVDSIKEKWVYLCKMLGKKHCNHKYHSCFGYKYTIRICKKGKTKFIEESGSYIYDNRSRENYAYSLPNHMKEGIEKEIKESLSIKYELVFEKLMCIEEDKYLFVPVSIRSHTKYTCKWNNKILTFFHNTVEGMKE